ncbi:MAG: sugar phosphate isomerase/epimerase family protein [Lachnospiraceae bacterium]
MKKGFSLFSFSDSADISAAFQLIKDAGYDGVEPVMSEYGYINPCSTVREIIQIKKIADNIGIDIPSVGVWSLWENNLVSNHSSIRRKAIDIIKKQMEIASILGADTILVIPGYVGCEFALNPEHIRYDIAYDRAMEAFCRLSSEAEKSRIVIGIENVWNKFLLSPLEMRNFIDTVNSNYVGVYFDVGNIIYNGYPEDWIDILGNRIKKVHLSDYRREQTGVGGFVDLFAGDVDFIAVTKALKQIGYDNYLTVEILPNYKVFPEISVYSNKYAVNKICSLYNHI